MELPGQRVGLPPLPGHRVRQVPQVLHPALVAGAQLRELLCKVLLVLLLFQLLQFIKKEIGLALYPLHHRLGLLAGLLGLLVQLGVEPLPLLLHLPLQGVHLLAAAGGGLLFLLQLLTGALQVADYILKAGVLGTHQLLGPADDPLRQPQALADGEGVGAPRHPDKQPVGGGEGLHVKFAAAVFHPRGGEGVHLDFRIVGGGGNECPLLAQGLQDGDRQGSPLHRIGARPQLVGED